MRKLVILLSGALLGAGAFGTSIISNVGLGFNGSASASGGTADAGWC